MVRAIAVVQNIYNCNKDGTMYYTEPTAMTMDSEKNLWCKSSPYCYVNKIYLKTIS